MLFKDSHMLHDSWDHVSNDSEDNKDKMRAITLGSDARLAFHSFWGSDIGHREPGCN